MPNHLTHLDAHGRAQMVNVGDKPVTAREAIAEGSISLQPATLLAIANEQIPKGEVLNTARIAGIFAAKRCGDLIPLCHPLPIDSIEIDFDVPDLEPDNGQPVELHIRAIARITAKTGVEMEALTAATVALLTVYDMAKAIDRGMALLDVGLAEKTGGASGDYARA